MMNTATEGQDPYNVVLSDLRTKRAQIDQTIALLESLRSGGASVSLSLSAQTAAQIIAAARSDWLFDKTFDGWSVNQ